MMQKNHSIWRQVRQAFGWYEDERIKSVHLSAARYGYVTAVAIFLPLGLYQQVVNGHPNVFWLVLSAAAFSALFLGAQWLRLKRWGRWDEMADTVMGRSYRWAYAIFLIPMAIYILAFLPLWAGGMGKLGQIGGYFLYNLAILITIMPAIVVHARQRTYPDHVWLTSAALGVLLAYAFFMTALFAVLFWALINA